MDKKRKVEAVLQLTSAALSNPTVDPTKADDVLPAILGLVEKIEDAEREWTKPTTVKGCGSY